jgi:hypothetical protein
MEYWNAGTLEKWFSLDKLNDLRGKQSMDRRNINTIPSFHYSIIPVAKMLFPSQISDQCIHLSC